MALEAKTGPALPKPDLKLNLQKFDEAAWQQLITGLTIPQPVTTLYADPTSVTGSFPGEQSGNRRYLYTEPAAPVGFCARFEHLPTRKFQLVVQLSRSSATSPGVPPYVGWDKPSGLVSDAAMSAEAQNMPAPGTNPSESVSFPAAPDEKSPTELIATGPQARYV